MDQIDTSIMYRIATALNYRGHRDKLSYKGDDTFLTNVNGTLKLAYQSDAPGQLWRMTAEGRLLNGTGEYLTAVDGLGLEFRPRRHAEPL